MSNYLSPEHAYTLIQQGKRTGWYAFKISEFFTWAEVFGSMQGAEWNEVSLQNLRTARDFALRTLDPLRRRYGRLRVTSWGRPPTYNKRAKGAPDSRHIKFDAADVVPLDYGMRQMYEELNVVHPGGLAWNPWVFIHIDDRPWRSRWTY